MKTKLTLAITAYLLFYSISYSQDYDEKGKLVAFDRGNFREFGYSVAISGNCAIVGAIRESEDETGGNTQQYAGAVYLYERDANGNWSREQKIVASDRYEHDFFGESVGISGNYAIVGAYAEDEDATGGNTLAQAGSAYIYERDVYGNWGNEQKIVASDRESGDNFGKAVSISGNYAVVGAHNEDEDELGGNLKNQAGSAYIFERDANGDWYEIQKIVASDRDIEDYFGSSVSISDSFLVVGADYEDEDTLGTNTLTSSGSAYIFEQDPGGDWQEVKKITAFNRAAYDFFGASVSISGNTIVVGAWSEDEDASEGNTMDGAGSAYVFECNEQGIWKYAQKIVAPDRDWGDRFGWSVGISGSDIIVGANRESEDELQQNTIEEAGSAYIFNQGSNGEWNEVQKIVASDRAEFDRFGEVVAISDDYAIVGVPAEDEDANGENTYGSAGSAYIFEACEADYSSDPLNVIENGSFETCILSPWNFYVDAAATLARYQIIDGTCILKPDQLNPSPEMWHIQIEQVLNAAQKDMLVPEAIYTLSFDAWGEVDNMYCHVFFGQYGGNYTPLLDETVQLKIAPQTFSFDFSMHSIFPEMKLALEIGTETTWAGFDNVQLIKESALGSSEISDTKKIRIAPNPATDIVHVFGEEGSEVAFYNNLGQLVKSGIIENGMILFQIGELKEGFYIIRVQKGNSIYSGKLIIY